MSNDELNQMIRMAQVLKMRTSLLHGELAAKNGPLSAKARKASELAYAAEKKLVEIFDALNDSHLT